jgi:membrane-associated phospholipid phosphatase
MRTLSLVLSVDTRVLVHTARWRGTLVVAVARGLTGLGDAATWAAVAAILLATGHGACLGPLLFALAFGIGAARVVIGAHYPLDVMAGAVLGALAGALTRVVV